MMRRFTIQTTRIVLPQRKITYVPNEVGHLADSTILCREGDSVVHVAVSVNSRPDNDNAGFLAMTVDYRSRLYAYGMIPDTVNRRERTSNNEEDIIVSRFIDRAVRPMFPKALKTEMQVTVTTHAADGVNDPTVMAVNSASMALLNSSVPWNGPVGCVRLGCIQGALKVNPTPDEMKCSTLNLLYAGTTEKAVMIEMNANELPEDLLSKALAEAQRAVVPVIKEQERQISTSRQPNAEETRFDDAALNSLIALAHESGFEKAVQLFRAGHASKSDRAEAETLVRNYMRSTIENCELGKLSPQYMAQAIDEVVRRAFRSCVLNGIRADGRSLTEVRPLKCIPDYLPRVHGSAMFLRGDTHVLVTTTLGQKKEARRFVAVDGSGEVVKPFFLHYDFPPYCTGDIGSSTALNRRMIGHGALAEKAVAAVIPRFDDFPYSIRVHSECTSSSGSSSMASVCGATLALRDAGVPLSGAVAGLSMGLVTADDGSYVLMTDIIGSEDYHGDMDLKVAGSRLGVTAIQLDTKLASGISVDILAEALLRARQGRLQLLDRMEKDQPDVRAGVKPGALCAETVHYDPERRRFLVGPGGEMLRHIEATYDCTVDADEPGVVYIYGLDRGRVTEARDLVRDLLVVVRVGDIHTAEVTELKDFGAFVRVTRAQEALLHVSEISHDPRLLKRPLPELLALGQRIHVMITAVDTATGQVSVSRKKTMDPHQVDHLVAMKPQETAASTFKPVPTFPVVPPRKWNADFFRNNTASEEDIEQAMKRASTQS